MENTEDDCRRRRVSSLDTTRQFELTRFESPLEAFVPLARKALCVLFPFMCASHDQSIRATTTVAAYQSFPPARFDLSLSSVHAGRWEDFMCEAQASQ